MPTVLNHFSMGDETLVNTHTANWQTQSSSTVLNDGSYVITWQSAAQDGNGYGVFAQHFDASGAPIGTEFQVNTTTANWQQEPGIVALTGGGFAIVWNSIVAETGDGLGIFSQQYDAAGVRVGGEILDSTFPSGHKWQQGITALDNGGYVVTWAGQNGTEFDSSFAQAFDALGNKVGGETQMNTGFSGDPLSTVALPGGAFIVSYTDFVDNTWVNLAQMVDKGGNKVGAPIVIHGHLEHRLDAAFADVWDNGGQRLEQDYNADGTVFGDVKTLLTVNASGPVVKIPHGGYISAWVSGQAIYAQQYDDAGHAVGALQTVETGHSVDSGPTITVLNNGTFVISYADYHIDEFGFNVYQRVFTISGADITGGVFETLEGTAGADTLTGAGFNTMLGGAGNDTYVITGYGNTILENANDGTDLVMSSAEYVLPDNVENLTLTGTGNANGTGNALANILTGNLGNNILDGKGGGDLMTGGLGDDTYYLYGANDVAVENAGEGNDTIVAVGMNYTLGANFENLVMSRPDLGRQFHRHGQRSG